MTTYQYENIIHGWRAKRLIEGPQICTKAGSLDHEIIRGDGFAAVRTRYRFPLAMPGREAGSVWHHRMVFPADKRYFLSTHRVESVNASPEMFFRIDMPGHIMETDRFNEIYLSYMSLPKWPTIPAEEFEDPAPPEAKFQYRREDDPAPDRFIRAYGLRDPDSSGKQGPWLAGMALDPATVYEAWCQPRWRGEDPPPYVCMILEFGGRPIAPGESFGAAFLTGYFDSVERMKSTYDRHKGRTALSADEDGWRLKR
jgi:hypothetical protein